MALLSSKMESDNESDSEKPVAKKPWGYIFPGVPKDLLYWFLTEYMVIPLDDPDIIAVKKKYKEGFKKKTQRIRTVNKKTKHDKTLFLKSSYFGIPVITAQHHWLRIMAQVCKSWRDDIYTFRRGICVQMAMRKFHVELEYPIDMDKEERMALLMKRANEFGFLRIEMQMTQRFSKHHRILKRNAVQAKKRAIVKAKRIAQKVKNRMYQDSIFDSEIHAAVEDAILDNQLTYEEAREYVSEIPSYDDTKHYNSGRYQKKLNKKKKLRKNHLAKTHCSCCPSMNVPEQPKRYE